MASSHGLMPRLLSLVIHSGQQKNSLPKNRILFSDLGNTSEIVNSLTSNGTVNQQARSPACKRIQKEGNMSTQKTREELPDRIDSKRRTKPCGVSRLKIRTWGIDY